MPELPEVAVFGSYLERHALSRPITGVRAADDRLLNGWSAEEVAGRLEGRSLASVHRHGKHLFSRLDDDQWLEWHFGMTGYLEAGSSEDQRPQKGHVRLELQGGRRLDFLVPRRLGHMQIIEGPESFIAAEGLGRDALDPELDAERLAQLAKGRNKAAKCWLMDQSVVAGIGNLYSDEILFQAGLSPRIRVGHLGSGSMQRLSQEMVRVLNQAITVGADPGKLPPGYLLPHRGGDGVCPHCGGPLARKRVCGRTAHFCPVCQPWPEA